MKAFRILLTILIMATILMMPFQALAAEGAMGYEGGISVENKTKKDEYQYSEMCFVTGKPFLLSGTLTIKKTDKNGTVNSTYTYKLSNTDNAAAMNRVVMYTTIRETKSNGQIVETTKLSRTPTEVITIGNTSYKIKDSSFSRSMLTDPKAAINYHAGEFSEEKTYTIGTAVSNPSTVKVTLSGRIYAYDQYWSSIQTQKINVSVETEIKNATKPTRWGGFAEVVVSSATRQQIQYAENEPTQISFEGGYVQSRWTESTLDYSARFPEFDKSGNPTDVLKSFSDTKSLSTSPELSRLIVPDIKHLSGYWAEEPISILFGLEIIQGSGSGFKVNKYVTRREFVGMLIRSLKEIPKDPNVKTAVTPVKKTSSKTPEISPFKDVLTTDPYYKEIKLAYQKGIVKGDGKANFSPNAYVTQAEAVKMIVSALGLENLAPYPETTTPFADNDLIPSYVRNAATVAHDLGIIAADEKGNFNPSAKLTNDNTANMIFDLILYMGDELIKDYRDRIIEF